MATAELTRPGPAATPGEDGLSTAAPRAGTALCWALLAALAYAVFADGAASFPDETRLQVALAALAALTCAGTLLGPLRARAPALAWTAAALLLGFAAWSGVTLLWSVAPDRTWIEFNRALAYALVVALGIVAGASHPRALGRIAVGYLVLSVLVALYALGGKIAPGVHIGGLIDLNQTDVFSRLRAPLQYWNALALVCVMGMPIAMWLAIDTGRRLRVRLAGLAALWVLLLVLGLTYSRGGFLALAVAGVVFGALGSARLKGLLWLVLAMAGAAAPLAVAFTSSHLTGNAVALHERTGDGALMGLVALASLVALLGAGAALVRLERRVAWLPAHSRRVVWGLAALVTIAACVGVVRMAQGPGGISGAISREQDKLTKPHADPISDPARLLSTNSGNRWVWWKEAGGAAYDRPLGGWGAGSFPVVHLLYRDIGLPVNQPHSMPLQFLAETGIVGALLACGGGLLLLLAGLRYARALPRGSRERALAAAVLAVGVAAAVHSAVDWDWEIPGATMPSLLLLGVLAGAAGRRVPPRQPEGRLVTRDGPGRALALAGAVALLCLVAISSVLPDLADSKTRSALVAAGASHSELRAGFVEAELAARLNPLSAEPLLAAASLAKGLGEGRQARDKLLDAVRREPYDVDAWNALIAAEVEQGDGAGALRAAERAVALDPLNAAARAAASRVAAGVAQPALSATAIGTPLPVAGAALGP